jgi:tetratricopeptide (TPR) repeat protein
MNRDWNKMMREGRSGDYLIGNIAVAGADLPWDPIPVNVTCDGKVRYTTHSDPKGFFAIARPDAPGSTTLQANPKPVADQYVGCDVDASLPGFTSNPLPIATRHVLDSPNIGTIKLRREEGAGDSALSTTSASAPKDATKAYDKARSEWIDNKPDRAQRDLQKAVEIYPQYAEAWYQLGKFQEVAKSPEAWNSFSKAAAADAKFALPYEHLAGLAAQAEKWQELTDATNHELALNPRGTLDTWYYNALGNFQLKNLDVAEASARKSLSMDPLHVQPATEQLLAVILAQKQDLPGALEHLRNCLTYFPPGPGLDLVKQQIAQIEPAVPAAK